MVFNPPSPPSLPPFLPSSLFLSASHFSFVSILISLKRCVTGSTRKLKAAGLEFCSICLARHRAGKYDLRARLYFFLLVFQFFLFSLFSSFSLVPRFSRFSLFFHLSVLFS